MIQSVTGVTRYRLFSQARILFVDIYLGGWIVADQDNGQSRGPSTAPDVSIDGCTDIGKQAIRYIAAVQNFLQLECSQGRHCTV